MSEHSASLTWARGDQPFTGGKYSREHLWRLDGGAELRVSASPALVPVPFSQPGLMDPEEAFVASLGSCHMLWFLSLAAADGWIVEQYQDTPTGVLAPNEDGRVAFSSFTLRPKVVFAGAAPGPVELHALHERAHASCFLASSVRAEVEIEPG